MNTYRWATVALLGIMVQVVWIGRALDESSLPLALGVAVMGAGVIQGLRGMQKQLDALTVGSPRTDEKSSQGKES
jgi:hypothetical protein